SDTRHLAHEFIIRAIQISKTPQPEIKTGILLIDSAQFSEAPTLPPRIRHAPATSPHAPHGILTIGAVVDI
ncbi:hypothetical protein, partial [Burkholderia sp. KCJ3K979]|uniref:hypothetical protein n=1 Tax=Burkholderia sp. KCJ3K979 TaxID=2759149 RepID=UPI001F3E51D1